MQPIINEIYYYLAEILETEVPEIVSARQQAEMVFVPKCGAL